MKTAVAAALAGICRRAGASVRAACAFSFVDQQGGSQRKQRSAERPLIALDRLSRNTILNVTRLHSSQPLLVKLLHRSRPTAQMEIQPASGFRDLPQSLFIELGLHNLSAAVFYERCCAARAAQRYQRSFRRPDADGENLYARICRRLRDLNRVARELLAIGEDDERAIADGRLTKCAAGERNSVRNVRTTFRNDAGIEIVERLNRGIVVDRERRLQK